MISLLTLVLVAGFGRLPGGRTVVEGTGPDELRILRGGPGLGFRIFLGLPDGTEPTRRDCVTEMGQFWCRTVFGGRVRFISRKSQASPRLRFATAYPNQRAVEYPGLRLTGSDLR